MPELRDAPRSAGGAVSRGRLQSAPRGASTSTGRNPVTGAAFGGSIADPNSAAGREMRRAADTNKGPGPGFTPIRIVLDAASSPMYAVGNLLRGDPLEALKIQFTAGQVGRKAFPSDAPIVKRGLAGIPNRLLEPAVRFPGGPQLSPNTARSILGLGLDFALDPLTYVTFGAGGVARGAVGEAARVAQRAAAQELLDATREAAARGIARPSARDATEAAVKAAESRAVTAANPGTLKINFRIPLTRGNTKLIAESHLMHRAAMALGRPVKNSTVGTAVRRVFRADQGVDPALYEGRRAAKYWAESTQKEFRTKMAEQHKLADKAGVTPERIARHFDAPEKYPALNPVEAEVFARIAPLRAEIEDIAREAGIDMGFVENHVTHMPADTATARAFEKKFGRKVENQSYAEHRHPSLPDFDAWEAAGLKPELNFWKLLDVRAGQGIRDASIKGYMDTLAARGLKPLPRDVPDVAGQAAKVEEAQAALDAGLKRADVAGPKAAAKRARKEVKAARLAVKVAEQSKDPAAIARAQRRLAAAEEATSPAAVLERPAQKQAPYDRYFGQMRPVRDVVAENLTTAQRLARDRAATRAHLPEPTGGRYMLTTDDRKVASRVRSAAVRARAKAKTVRSSIAADLRARAKELQARVAQESTARPVGGSILRGHHGLTKEDNWYVRAVPNVEGVVKEPIGARIIKKGKRAGKVQKGATDYRPKTIQEFEQDYLEILQRAAREGVTDFDATDRRILDAIAQHDELTRFADRADEAIRGSRGGAFGEVDPAVGAQQLHELASEIAPGRAVDMRALRAKGAARHGESVTPGPARNAPIGGRPKGFSRVGRDRFARYFNGTGHITDAIKAVREGAEAEVRGAQNAARRSVTKARKELEKANRSPDPEARAFARKMLTTAQRTERSVSAELARARVTFGANPRQIAARVRKVIKEQNALVRMERDYRKAVTFNRKLADRPGQQVSYELYRQKLAEGWQSHTSKYHKDTLLDPNTHEVLRNVDAEVERLIIKDPELEAVTRFLNSIGAAWKSLQLLTPRYFVRNVVDDGLIDFIAGARDPESYIRAGRIMAGHDVGTLRVKGFGEMTGSELQALAETQGVLNMGFAGWEVAKQQAEGVRKLVGKVAAPGSGTLARGSRKVNQLREDASRFGLFIEMLRKGEDPIEAGLTVRRYRFDYSDMSPALMHARAVLLPFLTFTWKNLPMLGHQLLERPGTFSHTNTVIEWLQEVSGDPDRALLAPWERDSFGLPVPDAVKPAFGGKPGEPLVYNPRVTFRYADFEMLNPQPEAFVRNWGGMLGPAVAPIEAVTGYSTYQARQLRPGERTKTNAIIETLHGFGVPIPGWGPKKDLYTGQSVQGYNAKLDQFLSTFPPFQQFGAIIPGAGNDSTSGAALTKWLTGINARPENRARALANAARYGGK